MSIAGRWWCPECLEWVKEHESTLLEHAPCFIPQSCIEALLSSERERHKVELAEFAGEIQDWIIGKGYDASVKEFYALCARRGIEPKEAKP